MPVGSGRVELYSEAPEEPSKPPATNASRLKRWAHTANVRWHALVDAARQGTSDSTLARWRDWLVRCIAESIAEQRTLWALRRESKATARFQSTLEETAARAALNERFRHACRYHGWWLAVDLLLLLVSAVLAIVPGPNVLAYYFAFRVFGHLSSWRGARHAERHVEWVLEPDDSLAELASLVQMPREARAPHVAAIAQRLNLSRLPTFFERMAT